MRSKVQIAVEAYQVRRVEALIHVPCVGGVVVYKRLAVIAYVILLIRVVVIAYALREIKAPQRCIYAVRYALCLSFIRRQIAGIRTVVLPLV